MYQNLVDDSSSHYRSGRDYYTDTSMLTTLGIANDESMIYPMLAIAVFLLLAGLGSYLLLKRLDKREWMWLTLPLLSACCVGVLCLMSSRMQLNKPAATAYSIYNISSDGRTSSATMAGVAIAQKENITVSSRENALVEPSNTYYSYYEEDDDTRRTCIRCVIFTPWAKSAPSPSRPRAHGRCSCSTFSRRKIRS